MERIQALREQVKIQRSNGNWNYDPYMHGMANGLICALATIEDKEPKYLDAPDTWMCDNKITTNGPTSVVGYKAGTICHQ